jgi:hypothetical protein
MRDGRVVAHDPDEGTLRAHPDVQEGDAVFPVGQPPSGWYFINV